MADRRWYRRRTPWLIVGLLVGIVLGAWVVPVPQPDLFGPDDRRQPRALRFLMDLDTSVGLQRRRLLDQWNDTQRWRRAHGMSYQPVVEYEELPNTATRRRSELLARARAGQTADVISLDATWTAEFAEAGYLRPITDTSARLDSFLPKPLDTCRYGGKLWALPFNTDVGLLYYNRSLVGESAAEVRTAWTEAEIDQRIAAAGPDRVGYLGQFVNGEQFTVNTLEALDLTVDADRKVRISAESYERLGRLYTRIGGREQRSLDRTFDEDGSLQRFKTGQVVFMRHWPVTYLDLQQAPATENGGKLDIGVTPLPSRGILGGQNLAIAATSSQPTEALRLIEFLTSPASQELLFEQGGFAPTDRLVYSDPRVRSRYPASVLAALLDALGTAKVRPGQQYYERFSSTLRQLLRTPEVLSGDHVALPDRERLERALTAALTGRIDGRHG